MENCNHMPITQVILTRDTKTVSYHPVSNLPFLSKVLEKCAMDRFNKHCGLHSALPKYQSAYW